MSLYEVKKINNTSLHVLVFAIRIMFERWFWLAFLENNTSSTISHEVEESKTTLVWIKNLYSVIYTSTLQDLF
jgi:hypothetical protein